MSGEIVFAREDRWLPRVVRDGSRLRLEFAGGADELHNPREFSVPIGEEHLQVLREDFARHLILSSALDPLGHAAGISGALDEVAAVALLDPILLGRPDEVDAFLARAKWERGPLVAHGADIDLLDSGRVFDSMSAATESADWRRAQTNDADRRRAQRGVVLSPLDAAILRYTGQYIHGSTLPRRDPDAVDPDLLPAVLRVVGTAERAGAGLTIARDPRRGKTGTDKADWRRMEHAVQSALRDAHPDLAADAVNTVSFLLCSEAARRGRSGPFDVEATGTVPRGRVLTFTDDAETTQKWHGSQVSDAVEAFWQFVAERFSGRNEVFTLEDETVGDGIQMHFYASSIARVKTVSGHGDSATFRVEYGLVDDLAHYRRAVREYVAGGFDALRGATRWTADHDEFEAARRRRRDRIT
ncbi:MAG: DUF6357 family protein [Microbacterium sp.]